MDKQPNRNLKIVKYGIISILVLVYANYIRLYVTGGLNHNHLFMAIFALVANQFAISIDTANPRETKILSAVNFVITLITFVTYQKNAPI